MTHFVLQFIHELNAVPPNRRQCEYESLNLVRGHGGIVCSWPYGWLIVLFHYQLW